MKSDVEDVDIIDEIKGTVLILNVGGAKKSFDLSSLFLIDEQNITKEFMQQAASYAYFATLGAAAEKKVAKLDMQKDQEYAAADEEYRKELDEKVDAAGKPVKYTEAVVKSMILQDEDYSKMLDGLESAKYQLNLIKAITRAFEQKAQMLQSLGSHLRFEWSMQGMHTNDSEVNSAVQSVKEKLQERKKTSTETVKPVPEALKSLRTAADEEEIPEIFR